MIAFLGDENFINNSLCVLCALCGDKFYAEIHFV